MKSSAVAMLTDLQEISISQGVEMDISTLTQECRMILYATKQLEGFDEFEDLKTEMEELMKTDSMSGNMLMK